MFRPLVALCALTLVSAPAAAATYSATTSGSAPAKIAARDILWSCASGACTGSTQNSRPLVLCQALAKKTGRVEAFTVDRRPISADELARCNSVAKGERNDAVANAR